MSHLFGGSPSAPAPPPPPPTPASTPVAATGASLVRGLQGAEGGGFGGTLLTGMQGASQPTTNNKTLLGA